jgi:hypothetical protein
LQRGHGDGAVFDTLCEIERAGVDCKDLIGLHESADPSGMEGRPGSADAVTGKPR